MWLRLKKHQACLKIGAAFNLLSTPSVIFESQYMLKKLVNPVKIGGE
jgi:hypothetical protein